jgi:hypothetical protein
MPRKKNQPTNGAPGKQTKGDSESIAGYFRKIFAENPKLLKGRSNEELLRRWVADHPGQPLTNSVKNSLSNLKSVLRKKGRKRKQRKVAEQAGAEPAAAPVRRHAPNLETLEIAIDDCMSFAKNLDRTGLEDVLHLLRRARNEVVWKIGQ